MRSLRLLAVAASLFAFGAGCETTIVAGDPVVVEPVGATLTVANDSTYIINEIHITGVRSSTWGPNLVPHAMYPGESVLIVDIACGRYDVMVTDETGLDCVLSDFYMCFSDHTWVIDDATLNACAFG